MASNDKNNKKIPIDASSFHSREKGLELVIYDIEKDKELNPEFPHYFNPSNSMAYTLQIPSVEKKAVSFMTEKENPYYFITWVTNQPVTEAFFELNHLYLTLRENNSLFTLQLDDDAEMMIDEFSVEDLKIKDLYNHQTLNNTFQTAITDGILTFNEFYSLEIMPRKLSNGQIGSKMRLTSNRDLSEFLPNFVAKMRPEASGRDKSKMNYENRQISLMLNKFLSQYKPIDKTLRRFDMDMGAVDKGNSIYDSPQLKQKPWLPNGNKIDIEPIEPIKYKADVLHAMKNKGNFEGGSLPHTIYMN